MPIAWYRSGGAPSFGGAERLLAEGLRCFRELGVEPWLLVNEPETARYFGREELGIARTATIEAIRGFALYTETRDTETESADRSALPRRAGRFIARVRQLRRTLARIRPALIVADSPHECRFLWLYSLGGRLSLPPIVTFIHGSPFQFADDRTKYALAFRRHLAAIRDADPVYRETIPAALDPLPAAERIRLEFECAALRAGVRMSAAAFVLTDKNRAEVDRLYGMSRVVVASPGGFSLRDLERGDATDARRGSDRPLLLSVCRLIRKKRVDLLLHAFAALLRRGRHPDATLALGGDGPERAALETLATTLGIDKRVRFTGFIAERELADWYRAADVIVSADNADYDLSVMMALPFGRSIVVSTQYSLPRTLAALERFFVVAEPSPDGYADAIARALSQPPAALGAADRPALASLTWERYFADILDHSRRATGGALALEPALQAMRA